MMAQSWAESTRDTCNYGQYINQFPQNTIKVIREFEWIQKKICRHKMSIMFNEICINEEMLPKYIYIYIYTYTHTEIIKFKVTSLFLLLFHIYYAPPPPTPFCHFQLLCYLLITLGTKQNKGTKYKFLSS